MSRQEQKDELFAHLEELTSKLAETEDVKDRAAIALLIAQARKELEQAREVREGVERPWWKSPLPYAIAIATFAIFAYFTEYLSPLIDRNAEINRIDEEINRKQAELQELENLLQERDNARISGENAEIRAQIERERRDFEEERLRMLGANESLKTQADKTAREMQALVDRRTADSGNSSEDLNAAEQALELARNTAQEALNRADSLRRYFLVLDQLNIENCTGVAGARLSRFLKVKDEPAIKLNDRKVWPDGTQSLECPDEHPIDRELLLDPEHNEIVVYETNQTGGNQREMGRITVTGLNEDVTCEEAGAESSGELAFAGGWCTSTFRKLDGVYSLTWKIDIN